MLYLGGDVLGCVDNICILGRPRTVFVCERFRRFSVFLGAGSQRSKRKSIRVLSQKKKYLMSYTTSDALLKRCASVLDQAGKNGEEFPTYLKLKADLVRDVGAKEFDDVKEKVQDMLLKKCATLRGRDNHVEVILLFDVDETLVIAENSLTPYRYNEELMNAWRSTLNCLNSVRCCSFLFTSQQLCTPAFVYRPADEPTSEPSRVRSVLECWSEF